MSDKELLSELEELCYWLNDQMCHQDVSGYISAVQAAMQRIDQGAKDAERYQWFRKQCRALNDKWYPNNQEFEAAIDAEITAAKGERQMNELTREKIEELRERSKDDHAIIVGSEVRQLCDMALRSLSEKPMLTHLHSHAPNGQYYSVDSMPEKPGGESAVVPREPTEAMLLAAYTAAAFPRDPEICVAVYRAMLAAAPAPAQAEPVADALALPLSAVDVSQPGGFEFGWCVVDANKRVLGWCLTEDQAKQLVAPFAAPQAPRAKGGE